MSPVRDPADWLGVIWTMLKQEEPVTPASLARRLSFMKASDAETLEGLNELTQRGLMIERGGAWDFTAAGWKKMA